jgi:hypothetical protein
VFSAGNRRNEPSIGDKQSSGEVVAAREAEMLPHAGKCH